jgi:hypothetical protein
MKSVTRLLVPAVSGKANIFSLYPNFLFILSADSKIKPTTSNHPRTESNNTIIPLTFDPMDRSSTKSRLLDQSSRSSIETGENDTVISSKSCHKTQDEQCDMQKEVMPNNERKLFAELPDPNVDNMSPDEFLNKLVYATCGVELEAKKAKSLENFFAKVTDEQVAAYTMAVVSACRTNDLDALKKLHSEEGQTMNCFNRFGESLLTMACRRGFEEIVEYLLQSLDVDIRICDDSGRTALHDACWNPSPQLKICEWIMDRDPALFFVADNRGCTPFQYARPEHFGIWRQFLLDKKDSLYALTKDDVKEKLKKA